MPSPKIRRHQLLGQALPVQIRSYIVERFLSGGASYADYDAHYRTLGHPLLFRHERWPSAQSDFTVAVAAPESSGIPNPNVMLEIGYARALHKPVVLLTDDPNTLPFDVRTQRALNYNGKTVGGGEFHRELVSLVAGVVARCVTDHAAVSARLS